MQPQNNPFVLWLIETINNLLSKSPKYMVWWQRITGFFTLVGWLPFILNWLGISVPMQFAGIEAKVLAWSASTALFMSSVTAKRVVSDVTKGGKPVSFTDPKALPFTAKEEIKEFTK